MGENYEKVNFTYIIFIRDCNVIFVSLCNKGCYIKKHQTGQEQYILDCGENLLFKSRVYSGKYNPEAFEILYKQ